MAKEVYACKVTAAISVCIMIKNSGELIVLAQPLVFIPIILFIY